ncbi:MAG TPA: YciI family protein [Actinomycetes bacterium]|nr:YciI family protein [Actinomycetes bacterium]
MRIILDAPDSARSDDVKYVVLIYSNPATWQALPAGEADRVIKVHNDLIAELTESGEFLNIYRLADAANTRRLTRPNQLPVVTDGPFGESKEVLASLWEIDVERAGRAIEIAEPLTQHCTVEVRPLMDAAGMEM